MLLIVREIGSGGFIYLLLLLLLLLLLFIYLLIYLFRFFFLEEMKSITQDSKRSPKDFFLCLSTWTTGDPDVVCGK